MAVVMGLFADALLCADMLSLSLLMLLLLFLASPCGELSWEVGEVEEKGDAVLHAVLLLMLSLSRTGIRSPLQE
jgi:hypothetical protein